MLNGIQATMHGSLGGILGTTSLAGRDLFYIGILCSLPFIVFQLISSMNSGGGAGLIQSIGFRIFVIVVAGAEGGGVPDFTPDGVFAVYQHVENTLYTSGNGSLFAVIQMANP